MRAYETYKFEEYPDVGDIQGDGRKSCVGRFREKGGDYKPYSKPNKRKVTRRYLKRADKARVDRMLERDN
jgi:hypothetical protein